MKCETVLFRLPEHLGGFLCTANRYTTEHSEASSHPDDLTLVFAHCASAHKEQWEVTIEKLFDLTETSSHRRIRESWALDCQSHGESSSLNAEKLNSREPVSVRDYGDLLYHFAQSHYVAGRCLVAIGHSASTSAWCLAYERLKLANVRLEAFVFIEPVMLTPPVPPDDERVIAGKKNVKGVLARCNKWDSMESLIAHTKKQRPWRTWDNRILEIHLKYGFKTVNSDDGTSSYVTPMVSNRHEAALYTPEDQVLAGAVVHDICAHVPMHLIFGERPGMVTNSARASMCDASQGRTMASIAVVQKAGHLTVQENPEGVAIAIFNAFKTGTGHLKAKL